MPSTIDEYIKLTQRELQRRDRVDLTPMEVSERARTIRFVTEGGPHERDNSPLSVFSSASARSAYLLEHMIETRFALPLVARARARPPSPSSRKSPIPTGVASRMRFTGIPSAWPSRRRNHSLLSVSLAR